MGEGGHVTLVNGTSHEWSLNSGATNEYQMAAWSWPQTVKSGKSISVYVEWKQGALIDLKDSAGNAQYSLSGTSYTFTVQSRSSSKTPAGFGIQVTLTNIATVNLGAGSIVKLGWKHDGYVSFVLAGSEGHFMSTDLPTDWMQKSLGTIGNRTLRHVCIPGSHDAGMSVLRAHTAFIKDSNVLTQYKSIGQQLALGSRYLDIRPCISAGTYVAGHYSYVDVVVYKGWQGGNGQTIAEIINDLNTFTATNKELVILNMSHAYNTDAGNEKYPDFNQEQWNGLFKQLAAGANNLFFAPGGNNGVDLTGLTINQFIGGGQAAVVIVLEPGNISLGSYGGKGFYTYSQVNAWNRYADTNNLNNMVNDQLKKMKDNRPNQDQTYFLLSWTLTQDALQAFSGVPSITSLADTANAQIYDQVMGASSKKTYPNILMVDGLKDSSVGALAVAINNVFGS